MVLITRCLGIILRFWPADCTLGMWIAMIVSSSFSIHYRLSNLNHSSVEHGDDSHNRIPPTIQLSVQFYTLNHPVTTASVFSLCPCFLYDLRAVSFMLKALHTSKHTNYFYLYFFWIESFGYSACNAYLLFNYPNLTGISEWYLFCFFATRLCSCDIYQQDLTTPCQKVG